MDPNSISEQSESYVSEYPKGYNANRDFTSLKAWKLSRKVKLFFYEDVLPSLPKEEKYQLGSQIRNAAISPTANIAEGYGRFHYQEGIQFYRTARGSLYELKDHLISCYDLNYVEKNLLDEGNQLIEEAKITLNGFIKYVKQQKINNNG